MPAARLPVRAFICYSHRDRKHLEKLRVHLAGLEREGRIQCWWDGALEVGKPWEPQILEAFRRSDVILILLTANLVASDYCVDTELRWAREREQQGLIDMIPILVDSFDLGAHWLGQLQAITVRDKAITQSRLGAAAWEHVARQIRLKVECLSGERPVMNILDHVEEVVSSGNVQLDAFAAAHRVKRAEFPTVSAFWKARSAILGELDVVTVEGTLSQYAPMLMGTPRAKRALHREFRKAIESHRRFGESKRLTINACMSISAGQMVHREVRGENKKRLLGLYESVVRNSIPIFVLPECFDHEVVPLFLKTAGSGAFEAKITGRLFLLDNTYIRRFLARQGLDRILPASLIDDLCRDAYALEVGGPGTKIERLPHQTTRYLDGDIWLAVKSDGAERFVTTFLDVTNETERQEGLQRLRDEVAGSSILASYDEVQSISQLLLESDG